MTFYENTVANIRKWLDTHEYVSSNAKSATYMLGVTMERSCGGFMKTLIVGAGALGGIIGARLLAAGASVSLATRNSTSAEAIKASGLRVTGIGGDLSIEVGEVAPLAEYSVPGTFDLIVLATKAQDAINVAPSLVRFLPPGGTLLPVQNGGESQMLASSLGAEFG